MLLSGLLAGVELGLNRVLQDCAAQAAGCIGLGNTPAFLLPAEYSSLRMARDFRLRSYNDYREAFRLPRLKSFEALSDDPALRATLNQHYGHIDQLEWLIGLFAESASGNRLFGDLLDRMVVQPDRYAVPGDGDDLGGGQRADADGDCLQGVHGIHCTASGPG